MSAEALIEGSIEPIQPPRKRPFVIEWGKKIRNRLNRLLSPHSLVRLDPILNTHDFPWLRYLEDSAALIQQEADQLLRNIDAVPPMNELSPDHRIVAADGGWRSFFLVGYRYRLEANCARCPETMKALGHVPGLVTALFSILEPGMHVRRHEGVSKAILVAHLGLRVPKDNQRCWMEVETTPVHWHEGASFVFDDTYEHEVWNDTDEYRVILLMQFVRPMTFIGRALANLLIQIVRWSPYIQDARRNVDFWEARFKASEAQSFAQAPTLVASS